MRIEGGGAERAGARKAHADLDGGGIAAGEHVNAEVAEAEDPHDDEEGNQHEREHRPVDADIGQFHGDSSVRLQDDCIEAGRA